MKHFRTLALAAVVALGSVQAQASAFQNGDFSGGDWAWTTADDGSVGFYDPSFSGIDLAAVFSNAGFLSQTFDTVATADTSYTVKFYLASDGYGSTNSLQVNWNGAAAALTAAANPIVVGTTSWQAYEAKDLIGAAGSSVLSFVGVSIPGYVYLDNVSVTVNSVAAVPEPSTYAMLLAGLGMMGVVARRRRSA